MDKIESLERSVNQSLTIQKPQRSINKGYRPGLKTKHKLPTKSKKRIRFIDEYLIDYNATKAAERSGFSKKTARQIGSDLLSIPYIAEEIERREKEIYKNSPLQLQRIVKEIAKIAFFDIRELYDVEGNILPINEWSDNVAGAVSAIETAQVNSEEGTQTIVSKVKFWDKKGCLEMAGRTLAMFTDKSVTETKTETTVHHKVSVEFMDRITQEINQIKAIDAQFVEVVSENPEKTHQICTDPDPYDTQKAEIAPANDAK